MTDEINQGIQQIRPEDDEEIHGTISNKQIKGARKGYNFTKDLFQKICHRIFKCIETYGDLLELMIY